MPKAPNSHLVRLQKVISDGGVTSRRKAEALIAQGKVTVNGEIVTVLGTKVDPKRDVVEVNGNTIEVIDPGEKTYLVLNKPRAFMTTLNDPEGRPTVMDLIEGIEERVYPVGRLDYLSEGLLILTNDGDLANKIMHPRYEITKVYEVKIFGVVNEAIIHKLAKGVQCEDGFLKPRSVRLIKRLAGKTWLEFRLNEGKNREIRKLCEACGLTIDKLRRVAIGGLSTQGIAPGRFIKLAKYELLKRIGMDNKGQKLAFEPRFYSTKKTLNAKKRFLSKTPDADDPVFQIFRKENYLTTMQKRKEVREEIAREELAKKEGRTLPQI